MKRAKLCDVIIVGAGLVGTLIARRLAEENQRVTILEATDTIGGNSITSTGVALLGTPELYPTLVNRWGEGLAAKIWLLTKKNLEILSRTAQDLDIPISKVGSFRVTGQGDEATRFQKAATMLSQIGIEVALEDATEEGFLVGLRTRDDLAFDTEALVKAVIDHPNIDVHTCTEVQKLKHHPEGTAIWARKYYNRAQTVILTGGAYTLHLHQELRAFVHPLLTQAIECEATSISNLPLILQDNAAGHVIAKSAATKLRMITWADAYETGWQMLAQAAASLCHTAPIRERWSGWTAQSEDNLPIIGEISGRPGVYTVNGLGPWGLSWAFVAANLLADLILQDKSPTHLGIDRIYA